MHENLRRLGRDRLELVYLRVGGDGLLRPGDVRFSESFAMMVRLREEGLIGDVGLSGVTLKQLDQARATIPIAAVQNRFHLLDRDCLDVLRRCTEESIASARTSRWGRGCSARVPGGRSCRSGRTSAPRNGVPSTGSPTGTTPPARRSPSRGCWRTRRRSWSSPAPARCGTFEENMAAARLRLTPADRAALDALA